MNPLRGKLRVKRLVTTTKTGNWCLLSYPNHPHGCPNYNKRNTCPPLAPSISKILDLNYPMYLAFSSFDLQAHVGRMMLKHPTWSMKQLKNVLYWQGTSRKQMRIRARAVMTLTGSDTSIECPEGMGVNVYATCLLSGLILQKIKRLDTCHHVTLIGMGK